MTTIAARDGVIAADSACFDGDAYVGDYKKLHRTRHGIVGGAGVLHEVKALIDWLQEQPTPDGPIPDSLLPNDTNMQALLLQPSGLIICYEGRSVFRIESPYQAIGSGIQFALGAMHAGASAEDAVLAACHHDNGSRSPIVSMRP